MTTPASTASSACSADGLMGDNATASSATTAPTASDSGVNTGRSCSRRITGGTGGSTRPTMRWPMTPTDYTWCRLGATVTTTLTWLPGTCVRRDGGTSSCTTPPRVSTINLP